MAALPTFPAFDLQAGDLNREWRKYVSRFENMLLAMNITSAVRKKAMVLHYVGEEVNEIFETLEVQAADENEDVFTKAEKALKNYFTPKCRFCGYQHVLGKNNCPAYGKQCRGCLKWNHFKGCCNEKREASKRNGQSKFAKRNEQSKRSGQLKTPSGGSRRVNNLNGPNVESSSEDEYVFSTLTVSAMSYQNYQSLKS